MRIYGDSDVALRSIDEDDITDLRNWKNAHSWAFFHNKQITKEEQRQWYAAYAGRQTDFMFIVEKAGDKAGCMGFRILCDGSVDTYNIIVGPGFKGCGIMKAAMALMCSYAADKFGKDIGCLVVNGNPAVKYYEACGYALTAEKPEPIKFIGDAIPIKAHVMKLDWNVFKPVAYHVQASSHDFPGVPVTG